MYKVFPLWLEPFRHEYRGIILMTCANNTLPCRLPPVPEPLAIRPIVLDTALSHLQVPSVKHRLAGGASGPGVVSRLFGWGK